MKKKKLVHSDNELVTRGILRGVLKTELDKAFKYRLGRFHMIIKQEIKEESHALEFRMNQRFDAIDKKFDDQNKKLDEAVNRIITLADKVVSIHENFEVESASLKHNYHQLEERVYKVESVVFPQGKSI